MVTPQGLEPMITGVRGRLPKPLEDGAIRSGWQDLNLLLSLGMNEHIEIAAKDSFKPFLSSLRAFITLHPHIVNASRTFTEMPAITLLISLALRLS